MLRVSGTLLCASKCITIDFFCISFMVCESLHSVVLSVAAVFGVTLFFFLYVFVWH